jgi:hypothetical protein
MKPTTNDKTCILFPIFFLKKKLFHRFSHFPKLAKR